jgi:protein TonB
MFDQTFVDGIGKTSKNWSMTLSFLLEVGAIGVMILVPLIWTEVLPKRVIVNSLAAPAPPPPPVSPAPATVNKHVRAAPRIFIPEVLRASVTTPSHVVLPIDDVLLTALNPGDLVLGIPGDVSSSGIGNSILPPSPPAAPPAPKADAKPTPQKPVPVGGQVQSAKLIKRPAPVYPAIAKSARIQGTVVLQAIIGEDGTVRDLAVISAASPLLVPAAREAVRQWVYQPTLLNHEPVEVITEITVIFSLQ